MYNRRLCNLNMKKLYEFKHPYYCATANYFNHECTWEYSSWSKFYEDHKNDKVDLNLIFRWDWLEANEEDESDTLQLSVVRQRTGIFGCYLIDVNKEDEPEVKDFLKPYANRIQKFWEVI